MGRSGSRRSKKGKGRIVILTEPFAGGDGGTCSGERQEPHRSVVPRNLVCTPAIQAVEAETQAEKAVINASSDSGGRMRDDFFFFFFPPYSIHFYYFNLTQNSDRAIC